MADNGLPRPSGQALVSDEAPAGLHPSGFDPSRGAGHRPGKAPCGSCPYRRDVPAGVWEAHEYQKLLAYDGEPIDQLISGGTALFFCHQQDGRLCAGWVGCHNRGQSMALRLHADNLAPETFSYESPVPLFSSGAEAAAHGMSGIDDPGSRARRLIEKLERKLTRDSDGNPEGEKPQALSAQHDSAGPQDIAQGHSDDH